MATMKDIRTTRTTCPYCGVGCGVLVTPNGPEAAQVRGDPEHPANRGRLCSKGSALGETLSLSGRLLYPSMNGRRVTWDQALTEVAARFKASIENHGPESVAIYGSGQLLTEDYYVANKLMKGFIGSANIDTNSRLCMSSTVAAQQRAFGEDLVPGCYEDLELADLVIVVGSNAAWCHPVLFQRVLAAKQHNDRLRIVTIDPRKTPTAESSDLHLAIRPGTDALLFMGLLHFLRKHDFIDLAYLDDHAEGFGKVFAEARGIAGSIPEVAQATGIEEKDLVQFFHWFGTTEKVVSLWSQGVNQSATGTDKVSAIINVHLATGRIGRPGMGPFSLTGQPNAMGGREVGGLANQLAAHLDLDQVQHREWVQSYWSSPVMADKPGLKAVDLFEAVGDGRIKALWIMGTNPAVSLPDAHRVREALSGCPFVVVSDCEFQTDLAPFAHVMLPAQGWGEKDGTVTNSERRISRQRGFMAPAGEARPDWWILSRVAQRMGFEQAFAYDHPGQIFTEHAGLTAFRNDGSRVLNLAGLMHLSPAEYDALTPVQWPILQGEGEGRQRLFSGQGFPRPGGKGLFTVPKIENLEQKLSPAFPLALNTGRIRDQWHTMTRTGKTARLCHHINQPYLEIHPADATPRGIAEGDLVEVASHYGQAVLRAAVGVHQRPGSAFMPMHWSGQNSRQGLVNALVNPLVDPLSGEPESKHTPVQVRKYEAAWHGFLLTRPEPDLPDIPYAIRIRGEGYWQYELAGTEALHDPLSMARSWLAPADATSASQSLEWMELCDPASGRFRVALLQGGRFEGCLFIDREPIGIARQWLGSLFAADALNDSDRRHLLLGKSLEQEDDGKMVCACFGVGQKTLIKAITQGGCKTPESVGIQLKAGTNCGSCVSEIRALIQKHG